MNVKELPRPTSMCVSECIRVCVCVSFLSLSEFCVERKTLLHRGSSLGWCRHESCILISPLFSMEERKRQDRHHKSFFHESIGTFSGKTTLNVSDRPFIHLNRCVGESGTRCHQKKCRTLVAL